MKLNHENAQKTLEAAIEQTKGKIWQPYSKWTKEIKEIILGSHLTYRYILVTGLLAKSIDKNINALSLQAKSKLSGAYDARSLCHKIVVPIERKLLGSGLGGSNEPFLNKPARFTEISLSNAVRSGADSDTLNILYKILSQVKDEKESFDALIDAVHFIILRSESNNSNLPFTGKNEFAQRQGMLALAQYLLEESIEGQMAALLTGVALDLHFKRISTDYKVIIHPINQSGASSKEVSDIDIKFKGKTVLTYEVKDKSFTYEDVEHAVQKVIRSGIDTLSFIKGPNGKLLKYEENSVVAKIQQKNIDLVFLDVFEFTKNLLWLTPDIVVKDFIDSLFMHAKQARMKDQVKNRIQNAVQNLNSEN